MAVQFGKRGTARAHAVGDSTDLARVVGLGRRDPDQAFDRELAELIVQTYARPGARVSLRPLQVLCLSELYENRGALALIPVGGGKTWITALAPCVMGETVRRPMLVVPGKLRRKTEADLRALERVFLLRHIYVVTYEALGRHENAGELDRYGPDLLMFDEAHKLKNRDTAVCMRVERYLTANPSTSVLALSGTLTQKGIDEWAHIAAWCLRRKSPAPLVEATVSEWGDCLNVNPAGLPTRPGALLQLADERHASIRSEVAAARVAFRDRVRETSGVVMPDADDLVDAELVYENHVVEVQSPRLLAAFERLRKYWETPDGYAFTESSDLWRHARSLALGLFLVWDPRPPDEWLDARRDWAKLARSVLLDRKVEIDSEYQLRLEIERAALEGERPPPEYRRWMDVKDTFVPNPVPVWVDDSMVEFGGRWLDANEGLVWTHTVAFARRLSKATGIPYFGAGGLNANGDAIDTYRGKRAILTMAANKDGRNLQDRYHQNLYLGPPTNNTEAEQSIGRTHRPGQRKPWVKADLVYSCIEHIDGVLKTLEEADYVSQVVTGVPKVHLGKLEAPVVWSPAMQWQKETRE